MRLRDVFISRATEAYSWALHSPPLHGLPRVREYIWSRWAGEAIFQVPPPPRRGFLRRFRRAARMTGRRRRESIALALVAAHYTEASRHLAELAGRPRSAPHAVKGVDAAQHFRRFPLI